MKKILLFSITCLLSFSGIKAIEPIYKNSQLSVDVRTEDLLSRMTLDEKIAQLQCLWRGKPSKKDLFTNGKFDFVKAQKILPNSIGSLARLNEDMGPDAIGPHPTLHPKDAVIQYNTIQKYFVENTRLGIPVLSHEEGLHGNQAKDATSFPNPIGLASSWNESLFHDVYSIVAKEIRYRGGHQVLAPVVDVVRDPRWGRTEETMGEDPFLNAKMGITQVLAYQGKDELLNGDHVAATLKHFGVHGQSEGGANTAPSNIDERTAKEVFLMPFRECIAKAKPMNIMVTYNELWGEPSHANKKLLKDILRNEFGYKGLIVSDYYGIYNLKYIDNITPDLSETGYLSFKAGIDLELPDKIGFSYLKEYVQKGLIKESEIDESVRRILLEKFRLGLFDRPYVDAVKAEKFVGCDANREVAYRAATESMVLLKNENQMLPLDKGKRKTIAFIGPNADRCILGGYSSEPKQCISPLQAMKEKYGKTMNVLYAEGVRLTDTNSPFDMKINLIPRAENDIRIKEAVEVAKMADIVVLFVGSNEAIAREAFDANALGDMPSLDLLNGQNELIEQIVSLGKPTCAFVNSGQPLSIGKLSESVTSVMQCWFLGQEGGYAMVDALFGDVNPSGKLTISIPRSAGHIPSFYNYKRNSRRGYNLGMDISPLYEFGYGLSYTDFKYTDLKISKQEIKNNDSTEVSVTITNVGKCRGAEVAQLYIKDEYSKVTRPVKELKGFQKIWLNPGESQIVRFKINSDLLAYYDAEMKWVVEPGDFAIMVGTSSNKVESLNLKVIE